MISKKRDIPWIKVIQLHKEIARRDEENFFALPIKEADSNRWSSLNTFFPTSFSGPWLIEQNNVESQLFSLLLKSEGVEELFIGGPCWFTWRRIRNNQLELNWQPIIYREVRIEVHSKNEFSIVPEKGGWDISPLFVEFMNKKGIQPSKPFDILLPEIIEKFSLKSKKENKDLTEYLIEELEKEIKEISYELNKEIPKNKVKSNPSPWVLFSPPAKSSGYNKNLMRNYEQLEKALVKNPNKIGGLRLLEDISTPKEYLFSWDDIPGEDSTQFLDYLIKNFDVLWVQIEFIEKINNGNTISVSDENNTLFLELTEDNGKAILTINNIRTDEFEVKKVNNKLVIINRVEILPIVPLNSSQYEAVTGILKLNPVTVISGPPGCGKSQVVISLLLNSWAKGISVLFASQNNAAVDVVRERLEHFESDFPIAVRAGSKNFSNIDEVLYRTLNIVASGAKSSGRDKLGTVEKYRRLSLEKDHLQDFLDGQIPHRVDQSLRSALKAYGQYQNETHELKKACELHIKEVNDLGYEISPYEFSEKITNPLRLWLEKINKYRIKINQDTQKKSHHQNLATKSIDVRNVGVQQVGLDPKSINNWDWLVSGPGYQLIESWSVKYRSLLNQPLEKCLELNDWNELFNEWVVEEDAKTWSENGREFVNDIRRLSIELQPQIKEIQELKEQLDTQSIKLYEYGISRNTQIDPLLLTEWLDFYATECSFKNGKFDWCPWSKSSKLKRKLLSVEVKIRAVYPLSVWRKIGELNSSGRENLSKIIELNRILIATQSLWNEKKNLRDEIELNIRTLRKNALELKLELFLDELDLTEWLKLAEIIEKKIPIAEKAAMAWKRKDIAKKTEKDINDIVVEFQSLGSGIPIKETWLKREGSNFFKSLIQFGDNPTPNNIVLARKAMYSETFNTLIKAWREAQSSELEFRNQTTIIENIPSENSRIVDWWNEKPSHVFVKTEDYSYLPNSDDELWKHLRACEDRDAKWKVFSQNTLPNSEKRFKEEFNWAFNHLKEAFDTLLDGPEKTEISLTVGPLLETNENIWPTEDLFKLFEKFRPEIIKGQIEVINSQLESLSFDLAKDKRLNEMASDIESQKAMEDLLFHYRKNYNRIEDSSNDLFIKTLRTVPIWITTAQSPQAIPMEPEIFDLLVIDEATQCTMTNLLPMIYRAKCIAVIGDPEQLPAITTIGYESEKSIASKLELKEMFLELIGHSENDVYKSTVACLPRRRTDVISLIEHYRCHPLIIGFSNQYVYHKSLQLRKDISQTKRVPLGGGIHGKQVTGYCVKGPKGESWVNKLEKDAVCELVKQLRETEGFGLFSIGVVTPFKAQEDAISEKLANLGLTTGITVGTAHKYQGDERDIMIFSPVVSKGIPVRTAKWVETPHNLINVAVTRAKESLFVIGDLAYCQQQDGILGELVRYVNKVAKLQKTSPYELELFSWMVVQGWNPEVHVQIRDMEVDFVLIHQGIRLAIEVDGELIIKPDGEIIETHIDDSEKDKSRDAFLMGQGYKVLHFKTRSIRETPSIVLRDIAKALELDWKDNMMDS